MSVGVCKLVMMCVFIFGGISKPNVPQWREAAAFRSHPFIEYRPKQKCISAKFPFHASLNVFYVSAGSQSEQTVEGAEAARQHFIKRRQEGSPVRDLTS